MSIQRIPALFYFDHLERALPTPPAVRQNATAVWIDTEHQDFAELMDDARFYASMKSEGYPDTDRIIRAARRLLAAVDAK